VISTKSSLLQNTVVFAVEAVEFNRSFKSNRFNRFSTEAVFCMNQTGYELTKMIPILVNYQYAKSNCIVCLKC